MKTVTTHSNGQTNRKTLSSQIDRLDEILDGLAEGLQGAVAGAIQEVMTQVVRQAVQETVAQTLQQVPLAQATVPAADPGTQPLKPTFLQKLKAAWNWIKQTIRQKTVQAAQSACRLCAWGLHKLQKQLARPRTWLLRLLQVCRQVGIALAQLAQSGWRHRRGVGVSLGAGVLLGLGSYLSGPVITSILTGLSGATLAAGSMISLAVLRLLRGSEQT